MIGLDVPSDVPVQAPLPREWTEEEDLVILKMHLKQSTVAKISNTTGRTQGSVKARINLLKKNAVLMRRVHMELMNEYQEITERRARTGRVTRRPQMPLVPEVSVVY